MSFHDKVLSSVRNVCLKPLVYTIKRPKYTIYFSEGSKKEDAMKTVVFEPIGTIYSPFTELTGMPIQPAGAKDVEGYIEVREGLEEGLDDVEGFSHIYLFYHFHKNEGYSLKVVPFMDTELRGLFSTRAPRRPNMLGCSIVEVVRVEGRRVYVKGLDILNETPLLDMKPYVEKFDSVSHTRSGWLTENAKKSTVLRSDNRFVAK